MEFEGQKIPDSTFPQEVMSRLAGAEPGTAKIEKMTSLEAFIRKIFAEEVAKKPRLTWGPQEKFRLIPGGQVGPFFNRFMTYIGPIGGFYIQNRRLVRSNGAEATWEEPSRDKHSWIDKRGEKHFAPSDYETLQAAYTRHIADAVTTDPLLCSVCGQYRATDLDDRMKHLFVKHPAEFAAKVDLPVETAVSDVPVPKIEPEPPETRCNVEGCGREFKDNRGLSAHKRLIHSGG